ncbi:TetR family transcriptional regulator [Pseudomonas knackmussii B13]|uniref:TetR family transcriptional regulator n=1 Tax=Pseudomonas knackmussii (strain DSM 6978 / CCUG 54928 / LMG 23759 / B13) TaxID=1301098 RepID=A0A024HH45_PSEKB|nr:TetR family transcriptional regulator [Pseudomonas knackmussii]CDF83827.1 TetR family transcriptional regulator [Pseudomonas knackmussii B13]
MSPSNLRQQQKQRTRQALLQAAATLLSQGGRPTLEEVAAQAMVSRATAYRYFPKIETLYLEASIDVDTPQAEQVLAGVSGRDAVARLRRVDDALDAMSRANEVALRMMLAQSLELSARGESDAVLPVRQNRRTPLIDAALEPLSARFTPAALKNLRHALALVMGPEAMIVFKDVLQLDDAEARRVRRWAIRALVRAVDPQSR